MALDDQVQKLRLLSQVYGRVTATAAASFVSLAYDGTGWKAAAGGILEPADVFPTAVEAVQAQNKAYVAKLTDWRKAAQEQINALSAMMSDAERSLK